MAEVRCLNLHNLKACNDPVAINHYAMETSQRDSYLLVVNVAAKLRPSSQVESWAP
jgi:hypothetical protein